jgi:hypothetical protein
MIQQLITERCHALCLCAYGRGPWATILTTESHEVLVR